MEHLLSPGPVPGFGDRPRPHPPVRAVNKQPTVIKMDSAGGKCCEQITTGGCGRAAGVSVEALSEAVARLRPGRKAAYFVQTTGKLLQVEGAASAKVLRWG